MTAEQLRNSILQEAISGRLVPQDPNDEPASVLLQRIREEKTRLVKEGKLKKKDLVETPITEEEIPFEIPASWEWVRYQDIADCALGKTKNPNQVEGELCQYLCSINVYWDSVRLNVLKEMLFSDTDKQKYSVEKGDMLICEGGEAGRSAIYEGNISPIYYQNALHRVRFYGGICTRFFLYQMELYKKTGLLTDHIKGETIQHFVSTKLLNLPIPLPPLAEQKRIVAKLEELLPIVEQYGKAQSELDELNTALPARLRQSILQEAISGRLVPQNPNDEPAAALLQRIREEKAQLVKEGKLKKKDLVEKPITENEISFEIPSSWEWVRLSSLCTLITKGTTPRGGNVAYMNKGIGFLRAENIFGIDRIDTTSLRYIDKETNDGYLRRSILQENDLLITIAGTLGRTAIVRRKDLPLNANQAISLCRWVNVELVNLLYIVYALNAPAVKSIMLSCKKITAIPNLTLEIIADTIIPLPPLAEQERIVAKIEELFEQIDKISK